MRPKLPVSLTVRHCVLAPNVDDLPASKQSHTPRNYVIVRHSAP
jgi:hypothetical protein